MGKFNTDGIESFGRDAISRMEELVGATRLDTILKKKEDKKKNTLIMVLAIIGAIIAIAAIGYAVYKFLTPDYLDDFEDDFEDDFDDDYFEDENEEEQETLEE